MKFKKSLHSRIRKFDNNYIGILSDEEVVVLNACDYFVWRAVNGKRNLKDLVDSLNQYNKAEIEMSINYLSEKGIIYG